MSQTQEVLDNHVHTVLNIGKLHSFKDHVPLPDALRNIVTGYIFYDHTTGVQRVLKNQCVEVTRNAYSRNNPYLHNMTDNDEEHWHFTPYYSHDGESLQLQAYSCIQCGNYKYDMYNFQLSAHITCNCVQETVQNIFGVIGINLNLPGVGEWDLDEGDGEWAMDDIELNALVNES